MDKNDPRRQPTDEELDELNEHWQEPGDPDGVFAEEQRQKWRELHPVPAGPTVVYRKKRRWLRLLIALVLLVAATFAAYWIGDHEASAPSSKPAATTTTTTKKPATKTPVATTKDYTSGNFGMTLTYPTGWQLTDTADKLTVASPNLQLKTASGSSKQGHVLVTVQHAQKTISNYPDGKVVEVLDPQKLTYTQPTNVQRAQSYLSYLGYTQPDGLDAIYVTGDAGFVKSQLVPMSDVVANDPLVSVSFAQCSQASCATGGVTPLTLLASSWQAASFQKQVMALLASIQLD